MEVFVHHGLRINEQIGTKYVSTKCRQKKSSHPLATRICLAGLLTLFQGIDGTIAQISKDLVGVVFEAKS